MFHHEMKEKKNHWRFCSVFVCEIKVRLCILTRILNEMNCTECVNEAESVAHGVCVLNEISESNVKFEEKKENAKIFSCGDNSVQVHDWKFQLQMLWLTLLIGQQLRSLFRSFYYFFSFQLKRCVCFFFI